jgi:hypothetical protein|tara:strand:+ start:3123 stop:3296 length:174 start_codon:yes stop_codon:yes gene_type:complete
MNYPVCPKCSDKLTIGSIEGCDDFEITFDIYCGSGCQVDGDITWQWTTAEIDLEDDE